MDNRYRAVFHLSVEAIQGSTTQGSSGAVIQALPESTVHGAVAGAGAQNVSTQSITPSATDGSSPQGTVFQADLTWHSIPGDGVVELQKTVTQMLQSMNQVTQNDSEYLKGKTSEDSTAPVHENPSYPTPTEPAPEPTPTEPAPHTAPTPTVTPPPTQA
jgi:outer membrane biosynthesis protein TonB